MQPTRKNCNHRRQEINSQFQFDAQHLLIGTYNGTKCKRSLAACSAISLYNAYQTYAKFNSHTLANAIIKLLPDYVKLQQLINETPHSQLPKYFCKKAHSGGWQKQDRGNKL